MAVRIFGQVSRKSASSFISATLVCTLVTLAPMTARAYCVVNHVADQWSMQASALRIPVYVSIAPNSHIEHTGASAELAARWVIDAIARHNEHVTAPKLYFGGFHSQDYMLGVNNPVALRPGGITVQSIDCALLQDKPFCAGENAIACGGSGFENLLMERVGMVTLNPAQCENINENITWSSLEAASPANAKDPIRVLLHELGHVLGLQHTNVSDNQCVSDQGGQPGPQPGPNEGVMRTVGTSIWQRARSWRRDDLDGFEALYGPYWDELLATPMWWADDGFPDLPSPTDGRPLSADFVRIAPVSTSAPWSAVQLVAWVDEDHRVRRVLIDRFGAIVSDHTVVDPSGAGRSWHTPSVALGYQGQAEYELVAWTAHEQTTNTTVTPRWAVRAIDSGEWSVFEGPEQVTTRVIAGFDEVSERFVLARFSNDGTAMFMAIDPDGSIVEEIDSGLEVLDLGAPACLDGSCIFPTSSQVDEGLWLGRLELTVEGGLEVATFQISPGLDSFGRVGFAEADGDGLRVVAGQQRFEVDRLDPFAPPVPLAQPMFLDGDWPLSVTSFTAANGPTGHGLVSALVSPCGDGVVEDPEQCDDGNRLEGDGCDAQCLIEDGDETGETGGVAPLEDNGCNCASADPRPWSALAWLAFPVLALWRRRRPW